MKAAVFKAPGAPLVIEEVPEPRPGPTDLILKVRSCGICGTDLHWSERKDGSAGWRALEPDTVMGHEFAGEVVEVGSGLRGQWRVGERVTAQPFIGCGHCPDCMAGRAFRCREWRDARERRSCPAPMPSTPGSAPRPRSGCPTA